MNEHEVVEALTESGALLDGHFRLSSGLHSPQYLQCAVALQHPHLAEKLGRELGDRWRNSSNGQVAFYIQCCHQ